MLISCGCNIFGLVQKTPIIDNTVKLIPHEAGKKIEVVERSVHFYCVKFSFDFAASDAKKGRKCIV
jgi:hypothetical protein